MYTRFKAIALVILQIGLYAAYASHGYCAASGGAGGAAAAADDKVEVHVATNFTGAGLAMHWSSPDTRPAVQDVLAWKNKITTVHHNLKQFYARKRLADRYEFAVTSGEKTMNLTKTATDAMAEHLLKGEHVEVKKDGEEGADASNTQEGADAKNRAKLIALMQTVISLEKINVTAETMDRLMACSMEREREHLDHVALYHGASGTVGFLYALYGSLYNLLNPGDPRKLMVRPFDKDFFGVNHINDLFAQRNPYHSHTLCGSVSVLHGLKADGGNAALYCAKNTSLWGPDILSRLHILFQGLGIELTEEEKASLTSLYETYFGTPRRGILLQIFCDPERFEQHVVHAGTWGDRIPTEELLAAPSPKPTLQFVKDLRSGHVSRLEAASKAHADVKLPLEQFEVNISVDGAFLSDEGNRVYTEYHPPFPADERRTFLAELSDAVSRILGTHPVKNPHFLWTAFHGQHLGLKYLLQGHSHVRMTHPILEDVDLIEFFSVASPKEITEYMADHPGILDKPIRIPEKLLKSVHAYSSATLEITVREALLRLRFKETVFSRESICQALDNLLCTQPEAFDLSDPRIGCIALLTPDLQRILIDRDIWGAVPVTIVNKFHDSITATCPSLAHVEDIARNLWDFDRQEFSPLGKLFQTEAFKAYVCSLPSPSFLSVFDVGREADFLCTRLKELGWKSDEIKWFVRNMGPKALPFLLEQGMTDSSPEFARGALGTLDLSGLAHSMTCLDAYEKIIPTIEKLCAMLPAAERLTAWEAVVKKLTEGLDTDIQIGHYGRDTYHKYEEGSLPRFFIVLQHYISLGYPVPAEVRAKMASLTIPENARSIADKILALLPHSSWADKYEAPSTSHRFYKPTKSA